MDDVVDRATYAVEVSLRKDGIDLNVADIDDIRDEIQRVLEVNGFYDIDEDE